MRENIYTAEIDPNPYGGTYCYIRKNGRLFLSFYTLHNNRKVAVKLAIRKWKKQLKRARVENIEQAMGDLEKFIASMKEEFDKVDASRLP